MRGFADVILAVCIGGAMLGALMSVNFNEVKEAQEDYKAYAFIGEPYLSSLSMLTYGTQTCNRTYEMYELIMDAMAQNSTKVDCGGSSDLDLEEELRKVHKEFMCRFGKTNLYLYIPGIQVSIPESLQGQNVKVISQLPIPLPNGRAERVMLIQGNSTVKVSCT